MFCCDDPPIRSWKNFPTDRAALIEPLDLTNARTMDFQVRRYNQLSTDLEVRRTPGLSMDRPDRLGGDAERLLRQRV